MFQCHSSSVMGSWSSKHSNIWQTRCYGLQHLRPWSAIIELFIWIVNLCGIEFTTWWLTECAKFPKLWSLCSEKCKWLLDRFLCWCFQERIEGLVRCTSNWWAACDYSGSSYTDFENQFRVKEPVFGHLRQNPIFWTLYFLFIIISCSNHEANIIII